MLIDPDSERAAAFRVLRHHLLELGRPQVVIVSSAQAGEGKTTTAMNLALALAECGRAKVLLAETHVRRPQLANAFRLVPPWCFAEQLAAHRNQPMLPWSLVEIPQLWLHVAAINPRIEKTQLLDAPAFAIAMERLRLAG
jgi:Mrp family chromosome partitioning ATPase